MSAAAKGALVLGLLFSLATMAGCGAAEEPNVSASALGKDETAQTPRLQVTIGSTDFIATLADNPSAEAFAALLGDGPVTIAMADYAGMEKVGDLGRELPQNNEPMNTEPGDIILYQGNQLAIYYDTNSWSLTPIARIDGAAGQALRAAMGTGEVTVTFRIID